MSQDSDVGAVPARGTHSFRMLQGEWVDTGQDSNRMVMGPPIASIGCVSGEPVPSRLASWLGRGAALPLEVAARAGEGPHQARSNESSPDRNLCALTPEVARPLAGN